MICKDPVVMVGHVFPCGQCMPCRIQRGRIWRSRILLEARLHSTNAFVTCTYSDGNIPNLWLPISSSLEDGMVSERTQMYVAGTLVPRHMQLFMKRLRKSFYPLKFRFFCVGEYGSVSWRPHYHAVLFGYPGCKRVGGTLRSIHGGMTVADRCCEWCARIQKAWPFGFIHSGEVTEASAGYISEYVLKKMTRPGDPRLNGRNPEFARMSLRPGIGRDCVPEMADAWLRLDLDRDVPVGVNIGRKLHPIGRYIRNKWRVEIGHPEGCPDCELNEYQQKLLSLREAAKSSEENPSFKEAVKREFAGEVLNVEARAEIFKRRKSL